MRYVSDFIGAVKARRAEIAESLAHVPNVETTTGSGLVVDLARSVGADAIVKGLRGLVDFESEVAVVLGDTPMGTTAGQAAPLVRLVLLVNDVTLRNLIPDELAKGFEGVGKDKVTQVSSHANHSWPTFANIETRLRRRSSKARQASAPSSRCRPTGTA